MDAFDTKYFRINKLLLSYIGLWPTRSSNKNIIFYCTILGILFITLPQIAYLFKHATTLADFYDVLPTLTGANICLMKVIGLFYKLNKFRMLIQHVRYDWRLLENHESIRILMEYVERSRMFTIAYLIFIGTGATSYVTAPLTVPILDIILASNVTRPKRLPHLSEFFLDLEKYYYILFAISCLGYLAACTSVIAIDAIYFALLQHSCGMMATLSHHLENSIIYNKSKCVDRNYISDNKRDKDVENIVQCVQLQIRIERLIQLIESTFVICLIVDMGLGVLFQCSACVMIVTRMNAMEMMRNGPLLLLQSSRIFFYSWIGQEIINHSSQVPVAAYNGIWYQTSLRTKKMFLFLLMKCQKPYRLTVAKLYVISLEGYSMIMKTSVSYVTLMMSLNSDEI
ncbi:odorant receptor Or1-like [Cataglyphis hispanica]|uniref:odorant receptor Or1-like n=1 Tax=Cataglyphis hispanica TaxID=1086592 RepID=UPI00217FD15B|nr:odorant receptor Or1-like [Cataglyphis hispanica]